MRARGWRIQSASDKKQRVLRLADMIGKALKDRSEYSIALIDVFSGKAFYYAELLTLLLKTLKKRIILVLHGGALLEFEQKCPHRVRNLLTRADRVVSPSQNLARGLAFLRADIVSIPNGLDLERYPFRKRVSPAPSLCWVRAFHKIYNPVMAVDTLALVRANYPDACLRMIGPDKADGTYDAVCRRMRDLGIQGEVSLVGPVSKEEIPKELLNGDIFINTTNFESFGVSVMEAAACGLCVVTTAVGELPSLWRHGENALLVPPRDPQAMAHAVGIILSSRTFAQCLSQNGRANAQRFDWSVILPQWENLFQSVLQT